MLSTTTCILTTFSSRRGGPYREESFLIVEWGLWWFYFDFWWDTWEAEATREDRFRAAHSRVQHCLQPWLDGLEVWQQKGLEQLLSLPVESTRWEQSSRTQLYRSLTHTRRQRMNISMQVHPLLWDDPVAIPQPGAVSGWQAAALCERAPAVRLLSAMTSSSTACDTAQSQPCLWHPFPAWMVTEVSGLFPSCKRRH